MLRQCTAVPLVEGRLAQHPTTEMAYKSIRVLQTVIIPTDLLSASPQSSPTIRQWRGRSSHLAVHRVLLRWQWCGLCSPSVLGYFPQFCANLKLNNTLNFLYPRFGPCKFRKKVEWNTNKAKKPVFAYTFVLFIFFMWFSLRFSCARRWTLEKCWCLITNKYRKQ